jgi:hypothetical protein
MNYVFLLYFSADQKQQHITPNPSPFLQKLKYQQTEITAMPSIPSLLVVFCIENQFL